MEQETVWFVKLVANVCGNSLFRANNVKIAD